MSVRLVSIHRIAGVTLVNVFYFTIQALLFLVITPWMLRILGGEVYGLWVILIAITGFASLTDLGVSSAIIKYVAKFGISEEFGGRLLLTILFGLISLSLAGLSAAIIVYTLRGSIAGWISPSTIPQSHLTKALSITALGLVPLLLSQLPRGILLGLIRHEIAGAVATAEQATLLLGSLVIGLSGGSIVTLASWGVLTNSAACLLSGCLAWHVIRKRVKLRWSYLVWEKDLLYEVTNYSLISWATGVGIFLFNSADRILVGVLLGPVAAGAYSIITGIARKINQALGPFTDVLMPFASSYEAAGQGSRVQFAFCYGSRLVACLLIAAASVIVLWAESILSIWISPEFSEKYLVSFRIIVTCYAVFSMNAPAYQISRGLGLLLVPSLIVASAGLATIGLIVAFGTSFGFVGVAVANLAYVATLGINLYTARKIGLGWTEAVLKPIGPPLLLLLALMALVQLVNLSIPLALALTFAILGLLLWMAIEFEGATVLLKTLIRRYHGSSVVNSQR